MNGWTPATREMGHEAGWIDRCTGQLGCSGHDRVRTCDLAVVVVSIDVPECRLDAPADQRVTAVEALGVDLEQDLDSRGQAGDSTGPEIVIVG
jgi:hypothetical protein